MTFVATLLTSGRRKDDKLGTDFLNEIEVTDKRINKTLMEKTSITIFHDMKLKTLSNGNLEMI